MGSGGTGAHIDASPAKAARQVDPGMEEILASIRRIISDDQKALGLPLDDLPLHQPPMRARDGRRQAPPSQAQPPQAPRVARQVRLTPRPSNPQLPAGLAAADFAAAAAPQPCDDGASHAHETGLDADLHRMTVQTARVPDVDTGLPPRSSSRPAVRLAAAPPVDYRPPEARERPAEAMDVASIVDRRLADIIRRAVAEHVDEVAQAVLTGEEYGSAGEPDAAPAPDDQWRHEGRPDALQQHVDGMLLNVTRRAAGGGVTVAQFTPVDPAAPPSVVPSAEVLNSLVSPGAAARISGAFDALTQRVAAERARTMEETVTDMLRPMLAGWLESHLPEIVERLVSEQVTRLSRGQVD